MTADRQLDGISECSADYSVLYFSCGSTVSCREEQPWFSSTVSCLSSSLATVSLTNRHSITHACLSPMNLTNTFQSPKKRNCCHMSYKDALVDQRLLSSPSKKIVYPFIKERILVQVVGPCCYKLRSFDAIKEETKLLASYSKPPFHRHFSRWRIR